MALTYIMRKCNGYDMLAYVDDFIGFQKSQEEAQDALNAFSVLCEDLGIEIAPEKITTPTHSLEWLGINLNTADMVLTIPNQKLQDVLQQCATWQSRKEASRKELQSLIGKLAFVSQCIPPARRYMARLLATLRMTPQTGMTTLDQECQKANGKRLITLCRPLYEIECDAYLIETGGYSETGRIYNNMKFPKVHVRAHNIAQNDTVANLGEIWTRFANIAQNEAVNTIVAIKTPPPPDPAGLHVRVTTDNMATKEVLSGGKAKDMYMAACVREIHMIEATLDVVSCACPRRYYCACRCPI